MKPKKCQSRRTVAKKNMNEAKKKCQSRRTVAKKNMNYAKNKSQRTLVLVENHKGEPDYDPSSCYRLKEVILQTGAVV